jgi:hypothetical protein
MSPESPCIDHMIILVHDLDAAASTFARLGFQSTPKTFHPHGTANRLQMLHGNFLELMAIDDPSKLTDRVERHRAFLQRQQGTFALAFRSHDIDADRAAVLARGIRADSVRGFRRPVTLPDGRETAAVVQTFFLDEPEGDLLLFFCRQHVPEAIWVPQWQQHENTARRIAEVAIVARETSGLGAILSRIAASAEVSPQGLRFPTPSGDILLQSPQEFARDTGLPAAAPRNPSIARITVEVDELDIARAHLRRHQIRLLNGSSPDRLRVEPSEAYGLVIDFVSGGGTR